MDEFVEHLCSAQHVHVLRVAVGNTLEEGIHVEVVDQTGFL